MSKFKNGTITEAEIGGILLALEHRDYELFGLHFSGKKLLNRNNPHVRRMISKADKKLVKKVFT